MDTTIVSPRPGAVWLLAYALLGLLATACGLRSSGASPTPTLIAQPTPDRTVDAVVRGLVTLPPLGTPGTITTGTAAATPLIATPSQPNAPVVVTPFLAPAAGATATPVPRITAAAAPVFASPTLAPTRPPATLVPTVAPAVAPTVAPALAPPTAAPPTAVPPTRAPVAAPTVAPTRAVAPPVAPTVPRPAPTVPAPPTFGRGGSTS